MAFADAPGHHQSHGVHNQHVPGSPGKAKRSISSPLAAAAPGLHSPVGICISSKHRLSLVWGSKKNDYFFYFLVTCVPFITSPKLHFQPGEMSLGAPGANDVLICLYNLKERNKTPYGETFTWKELLCSALISVLWLTLSGDKPGALLLYLWDQAAEVFLSWKQ